MPEMYLGRMVVHARTREPLALLRERDTDRCLVVSVRSPQAEVMVQGAMSERDDDHRLTQDLVADLATALGRSLDHGSIDALVDSRFKATLVLDDGTRLAARPSDVLAVVVRDGLPLQVAAEVLDTAGQSWSELDADRPEPARAAAEEVQALRQMLDDVTADDFRDP
jgi:bifunctional DNase/RNase